MPDSNPVSLLLAEGNRPLRETARAALDDVGYRVTATATGREAVALQAEDEHDVLLIGTELPDLAGIELVNCAREANPDTAIVMMTVAGSGPSVVDAIRAGADDALVLGDTAGPAWPADLGAELDLIITRGLERRRLISENRELRAGLAEKAKLNDVVAIAGTAAHDMNQPLTVMSGITELLLMDADPEDPALEDMEALRRATQRLCDIVGRLSAATNDHRKRSAAEAKALEHATEGA